MGFDIAYLSQGKLYLHHQGVLREIESEFGQSVQQRRLQIQRSKAWKDRGLRSMTMPPAMVKQLEQQAEATVPVLITSLCAAQPGKLMYALEADDLGGLFQFDPQAKREERLFHNTDFRISDLDYAPGHNLIACTKTYKTGIANLATLTPESIRPKDVTEGDSLDLAPKWMAGPQKALVYQSAGVRRNSEGFVIDRAPFKIEKLDFDQQEVLTLAEDPKSDLLGPQLDANGQLYYIKRPYRSPRTTFSLKQFLKDLLLLPLRLLYAVFQFFNAFSQMFTGRPLMTAGSPQKIEQQQQLRTLGGWITLENLPKKHVGEADAPALVPPTWQLVRQGAQGVPEVLAKSAIAYDLAPDGTVAYTNGSGIYVIHPDGQKERVLVGKWVETVKLLEPLSDSSSSS